MFIFSLHFWKPFFTDRLSSDTYAFWFYAGHLLPGTKTAERKDSTVWRIDPQSLCKQQADRSTTEFPGLL
jgi:hypothetical protein